MFSLYGYGIYCNVGNTPGLAMLIHSATTYNVLLFSLAGFFLTRFGTKRNLTNLILIGALLFFSALMQTCTFLWENVHFDLIGLVFNTENRSYSGPYNSYYYLHAFLSNTILSILYAFLAYRIIFNMWDRPFRIRIFTYGLVACLVGAIFWFMVIGKLMHGHYTLYSS